MIRIGDKVDLGVSELTRRFGVGGTGTVTAVKLTDPVNKRGLVIVSSPAGFLHCDAELGDDDA